MAAIFNVGDIITGLRNNGYINMCDNCIAQVNYCDEHTMDVVLLGHTEKALKSKIGMEFPGLRPQAFKLATEEEKNAIMNVTKEVKERATETFKFRSGLVLKLFESGKIESTFNPVRANSVETNGERIEAFKDLFGQVKDRKKGEMADFQIVKWAINEGYDKTVFSDIFGEEPLLNALDGLLKFFVEFHFEPNFRFINTLGLKAKNSVAEAKEYINNYFALTNSAYTTAIKDKIKSPEFDAILNAISLTDPESEINSRFKVYYGSQGTGKTTLAMKETDNRCIICNNSMLPQDLMEDFDFEDGKPGFHRSMLRECMTSGKGLTLDEINLLPFETIRFLQGILDGKKEFIWKGSVVKIADGFFIIGTMNLVVNGMAFGLPEPLVDRCSDIRKSNLTAKDLISALR